MKQHSALLLAVGFVWTGCADQVADPMDELRSQVEARATVSPQVFTRMSDEPLREEVARTLEQPLSLDGAVRLAILNNATMQTEYDDLGIAREELIQAGLLPNPVFEAELHFRGGGIGTGTNLSLTDDIVAILQRPLRKRVAEAKLRAATSELTGKVLDLIAQVKTAYVTVQAENENLARRREVVEAAALAAEVSRRQRRAGNVTESEALSQELLHARARKAFLRSELEAESAREELNDLLGLWGGETAWTLNAPLPAPPSDTLRASDLEPIAMKRRPELDKAREEIAAAAAEAGIENAFAWLSELEAGVDVEGEEGESESLIVPGPNFRFPLPIFDVGASRRQIAALKLRQALKSYHGLAVRIRSEVRRAALKMEAAAETAAFERETVMPAAAALVRSAQLEHNAMLLGVFDVLRAKQEQIEAIAEQTQSIRDYWIARAELERATGGELTIFRADPLQEDVSGTSYHIRTEEQ